MSIVNSRTPGRGVGGEGGLRALSSPGALLPLFNLQIPAKLTTTAARHHGSYLGWRDVWRGSGERRGSALFALLCGSWWGGTRILDRRVTPEGYNHAHVPASAPGALGSLVLHRLPSLATATASCGFRIRHLGTGDRGTAGRTQVSSHRLGVSPGPLAGHFLSAPSADDIACDGSHQGWRDQAD